MNPTRRRVPPAVWVGFGVLVGLSLVGLSAAPTVVTVSPGPDSPQVPSRASIRIEFNRAMDSDSVKAHVSIEPRMGGRFRWLGTSMIFEPESAWPEGTMVVVRLSAGALSARGIPLWKPTQWSFTIGGPRVVFLSPAGGAANLQALALNDGSLSSLTEVASGVEQYRISDDGTSVVYSMGGEEGEIRRLDLATLTEARLYSCPPNSRCTSPVLSPDGTRLALAQSSLIAGLGGQSIAGPSEIWQVILEGDAAPAAVSPADHAASLPEWTPQGWLAYYDHTLKAFAVVDAGGTDPEPFLLFPSEVGEPGSWSPDGLYYIFPDVDFVRQDLAQGPGERSDLFFSHLYRWAVDSPTVTDLSRGIVGRVEDASPAYSPDGQWIAFARKYLEPGRWTIGRQLWLMQAGGGDPRQLTHDPVFNYSSLAWNADSDALVYMRFNQSEINQPPQVWLYDLKAGQARQLAVGGYLPQWIP
jgi:Tol biopolymer transport system component